MDAKNNRCESEGDLVRGPRETPGAQSFFGSGLTDGIQNLTLALANVLIKNTDHDAICRAFDHHPVLENLERFRMSFSNHVTADLASLVVG